MQKVKDSDAPLAAKVLASETVNLNVADETCPRAEGGSSCHTRAQQPGTGRRCRVRRRAQSSAASGREKSRSENANGSLNLKGPRQERSADDSHSAELDAERER